MDNLHILGNLESQFLESIVNRGKLSNFLQLVSFTEKLPYTESENSKFLPELLGLVGNLIGANRTFVFSNRFDLEKHYLYARLIHEWNAEGIEPKFSNATLYQLRYDELGHGLYDLLFAEPYLAFRYPSAEYEQVSRLMESLNIKSLILIPVKIGQKNWGFVGASMIEVERDWDELSLYLLSLAVKSLSKSIEFRDAYKALVKLKDQADKESQLKSSILKNMSHEINTPMNGILGYADVLSQECSTDSHREMAGTIYRSAERLMETLSLIIDLARLESSEVVVNLKEVNVSRVIGDCVNSLEISARLKGLHLSFVPSSTKLVAEIDEYIVRSIVINLLNNAIKFTNEGSVVVRLNLTEKAGKDYLSISVQDTGIGIKPEDIPNIFSSFKQLSEGFDRGFEGLGLGLTLVKRFTDLIGAALSVQSELGKGTTFNILLPRSNTVDSTILNQEGALVKRILVVEDDDISRELMVITLQRNYIIDVATDGFEAIDMINSKHYDLIIMDIFLRGSMNGLEAAKIIKSFPKYSAIPIIAVTAFVGKKDETEILSECNYYMPKPLDTKKLREVLAAMLSE